ncbi:MAG: DUF1573 domain-containing protein [Bacteroidota bacterium]
MSARMFSGTSVFSLLLLLILGATACQNDATVQGEKVQEIIPSKEATNAEIIRNPVSADEVVDKDKVAIMTFKETEYDFGTIKEGEVVKHTFSFVNTGKVPLLISNARSTCGCTVPKWPKEPIAPGESGKIKVRFNSTNKRDRQNKPVTITANTYPNNTVVHIKGFVQSDKSTAEKQ